MRPDEYPKDMPYDRILKGLHDHPQEPGIEEAKELARQDIENMARIGKITDEERRQYLSILGPRLHSKTPTDPNVLRN